MEPYVSVQEADEIVRDYAPDTTFGDLSDERKLALLIEATLAINSVADAGRGLGFKGRKISEEHENEFPRDIYNPTPYQVKLACAIEAAANAGGEYADRLALRRGGVKSVNIGGAAEAYERLSGLEDVLCRKALSLLLPFIKRAEAAEIV